MSAAARSALAERSEAFDPSSCFDAALAAWPVCVLPVDQVIDLLQVTHAPAAIEQFRRAMEDGERFPPVSVVRLVGIYFIADGHKRFSAYQQLEPADIPVEVWTTRRWLADQWRQLAGKTIRQVTLARRCFTSADGRRQAARLFWDTLGHWQRVIRSLASRLRPPRQGAAE